MKGKVLVNLLLVLFATQVVYARGGENDHSVGAGVLIGVMCAVGAYIYNRITGGKKDE